jgi:hypothetical protein
MPYYRKTALVFAEQFLPDEGKIPKGVVLKNYSWHDVYEIETIEGVHEVRPGDYICTGGFAGEQWNVEKSIFEATYEEVKDPNGSV